MNFCESCGAKLEKGAKFCEACGAKVPQTEPMRSEQPKRKQPKTKKPKTSGAKQETRTSPKKKVEMKPLTKKQKLIGGSIIGLLIFLLVGYNVGASVYSRENQTDRIIEALSSNDAAEIADVVESEDPEFEVTEDKVAGFVAYVEENPDYLTDLVTGLQREGNFESFYLSRNGKKMGLYDSYTLRVRPVSGTVYTNLEDVTVSVNDEELFVSDDANYKDVGPFFPGFVTFTAEGEVNELPLTVTEEVAWLNAEDYHEVDLTLTGFNFDVYSELENATVYVDDQEIGQLENGSGYFGPIQFEEGMQLHVAQTFGDEEVVSEKVDLVEDQTYYEFYDLVTGSESEAESVIKNAYNTVYYLSRNYDSYKNDLDEYYDPEGPAYSSHRAELLSLGKRAYDNDDVSELAYDVTINEVERTGEHSMTVRYEVSLSTNYFYNSDKEDGLTHYEKEATVHFEPTDHPHRDYDVFIYEITNEDLIYQEGHSLGSGSSSAASEETDDSDDAEEAEEADSADSSASDEESARAAVSGFVENLPGAVNDDNFSAIAGYMDSSSSFYDTQSSFVTDTHNSGITERLDNLNVTSVEVSGDTAKVVAEETFTIWNNGSESQTSYTAIYDLKKVDGEFLITNLAIE